MHSSHLRHMLAGQSGVISKITCSGELGRRIRDMGLVPGTPIRVEGRAPLKDPVAVRVRNFTLTLRNNEADAIEVEVEETGAAREIVPQRRGWSCERKSDRPGRKPQFRQVLSFQCHDRRTTTRGQLSGHHRRTQRRFLPARRPGTSPGRSSRHLLAYRLLARRNGEKLTVDGGVRLGFNDAAPDWNTTLGVTVSF